MKDKRKQPRWWQHFISNVFGYFWLPCPICGECFGGQEEPNGLLCTSYKGGEIVCANCVEKAERRNKKNNYFIPTLRLRETKKI